jgi:hypothetical protein
MATDNFLLLLHLCAGGFTIMEIRALATGKYDGKITETRW